MRKAILLSAVLSALLASTGCSPFIGWLVRETAGGPGQIRAGESRAGSTSGAPDRYAPNCGTASGGGDQAYVFVPDRGGTYRIDLRGGYDCVLAVFDESDQPVACNDDSGSTTHSMIEQRFEALRRYTIVVDGYRGQTGSYVVEVQAVQLDEQVALPPPPQTGRALVLSQRREGNTALGTDSRTPPCGSTPGSPDEVWTFTPSQTGTYQIDVDSTFDGTLAVYPQGVAEPLGCNDDHGTTRASQLILPMEAGRTYEVVIDGYHGTSGTYGVVVVPVGGAGPAAPVRAIQAGQPARGTTVGHTDARQSTCGSQAGAPDEIWTFTPPRTAAYQIHVDADFDSVLAVFAQGTPAPIECNDDFQSTRASRLTMRLEQGRTYEIVIDGYGRNAGNYYLSLTEITQTPTGPLTVGQTVTGNTAGSADTVTPPCGSRSGTPDQTWTFRPPASGMYRLDVQAEYDAVLALYAQGNANAMACNDDFQSTRDSRIEASLDASQTYQVVVDGFSGGAGGYRLVATALTSSGQVAPPPPPLSAVENITALERRCASAPPLPQGETTVAIDGTLAHARPSCRPQSAGELVYRVEVQQTTLLTVEADSSLGPVLELRAGCSSGHTVVACDPGSSGQQSTLHARVDPGRPYFLIVDTTTPGGAGAVRLRTTGVVVAAP